MNLIEGLLAEMNRNRELLNLYEEIPTGTFGAAMIKQEINKAKNAIADGDIIKMVRCYKKLQENE